MNTNEAIAISMVIVGSFVVIPALAIANQEWAALGLSLLLGVSVVVIVSKCKDL